MESKHETCCCRYFQTQLNDIQHVLVVCVVYIVAVILSEIGQSRKMGSVYLRQKQKNGKCLLTSKQELPVSIQSVYLLLAFPPEMLEFALPCVVFFFALEENHSF